MKKESPLTHEEIAYFRKAMKHTGVTVSGCGSPLKKTVHGSKRNPSEPKTIPPPPVSVAFEPIQKSAAEDKLFFAKTGVSVKTIKNLKQGKYKMGGILDLHRKTVSEAHDALVSFIRLAQKKNIKTLLIIHGKGHRSPQPFPILKNIVFQWVSEFSETLVCCSALPKHGGTGALYLLIKSKLNES